MADTQSCLVFYIEEITEDDKPVDLETINENSIDTKLFITYDILSEDYVIYGKRQTYKSVEYREYFFRSKSRTDLYDFVKTVIPETSRCNFTLYNYNNMPYDVTKCDFEFMENNKDKLYEIVGYDLIYLDDLKLKHKMKMLKHIFNYC